jgi:HK97 family phage major capsid protein
MGQTNMNLIRKSNALEAVKTEVQTRIDRSRDDERNLSSELFSIKNPDIDKPMHEWLKERTAEATNLAAEVKSLMGSEETLNEFDELVSSGKRVNTAPVPSASSRRSLGAEVLATDEFEAIAKGHSKSMVHNASIELKSLFETTGTSATDTVSVESVRTGEYVTIPRTRVTLFDIIPQLPTTEAQIKYDVETKNLSNVDPIAQGAIYQESEFQIEERNATVYKSGAFIQVSEELMDDAPEIRARLDGSLRSQMMRRIQADMVGGVPVQAAEYVGTPANNANVVGFLDVPGANINELDGTGINAIAALEDGAELVYRLGEAETDAIVMNSQDWVDIKKLQSTTGSFVLRGANSPLTAAVPRQIDEWQVVLCNALPRRTVLMGAFNEHCTIRDRQAVQVRVQEALGVPSQAAPVVGSNAAVAIVNTQPTGRFNIYTDARLAFYIRRPLAFTRITNFGV